VNKLKQEGQSSKAIPAGIGGSMFSAESRELMNALADEEYRREFVSENVATGLAFQIGHLRDSRGWTQEELAERMGKARQETISQWENPNYGRYSVSTLKKLAAAFDVALIVRFAPFSELASRTVRLTAQDLAPPSFEEEFQYAFVDVAIPAHDSITGLVSEEDMGASNAGFRAPEESKERENAYAIAA
jgi:transcriptional regulator with XRE-family HTH domain